MVALSSSAVQLIEFGFLSSFYSPSHALFPASDKRGPAWLLTVGILSSLLYLFVELWYHGEFHSLPEKLMVTAFFISIWRCWGLIKRDVIFGLMLLSIILPLMLFGLDSLSDPESAKRYWVFNEFIVLFLFLPLAWWIAGNRKLVGVSLGSALAGILLAILMDPSLGSSLAGLAHLQRVDFGIHNAQHAGLFFSFCILLSLTHLSLWFRSDCRTWVRVGLVAVLLIGFVGVIATQTRAMYLGLVVCGLVAFGLWVKRAIAAQVQHRLSGKTLAVMALVVVAMGAGLYSVSDRFKPATEVLQKLIAGNLQEVPYTASGIRIHFWAESMKWIAEKPIHGWGRRAREDVINEAEDFPQRIKDHYGHLHNSYLELLLGYGIVGLAFVAILWITLLRRIKSAADPDTWRFVFYGSLFFFVVNFFESYFFYWSGRYYFSLLMGVGYSFYLSRQFFQGQPSDKTQPG